VKVYPNTLLVVTADHETGGLKVNKSGTRCLKQKGCLAQAEWTSPVVDAYGGKFAEHTRVNVPLFALGVGAESFVGKIDNTAFYKKMVVAD
jgi:alkaline phosphatase